MPRPRAENPRNAFASVRLTAEERAEMEMAAERRGFSSLSEYLRHLHARAKVDAAEPESNGHALARAYPASGIRTFHKTRLGRMLCGDARCHLMNGAAEQSVDLIMTSPPFGLVRKKTYGNEDAHRYCDWFRPFAEGFRRVLKAGGSLVIDIGGAWKPGTPTRSLYHFELLLMLCEDYGFHLCQEHYWWNPSKLPTPAEWVNVRRVRVKDAVNCVWWLSPTPWPKASNRRVLAPYSASMRDLLKHGYKAKLRPSGHQISDKFGKDNGGVGSTQPARGRQYRIERTLPGLLPAERLPDPPGAFSRGSAGVFHPDAHRPRGSGAGSICRFLRHRCRRRTTRTQMDMLRAGRGIPEGRDGSLRAGRTSTQPEWRSLPGCGGERPSQESSDLFDQSAMQCCRQRGRRSTDRGRRPHAPAGVGKAEDRKAGTARCRRMIVPAIEMA